MGVSIGYLLVHERWDLLERGNLSVDLEWKVAWGLSRTPVLGRRLSIEDSEERSERPSMQVWGGRAPGRNAGKKGQGPEVSQESELGASESTD